MPVTLDTEAQVSVQPASAQAELVKSGKPGPRNWVAAIVVSLAILGALTFGILPRVTARNTLRRETAQMALPTVAVVHPEHTSPANEVVLPANVQAFVSAPIYARTNGYLKKWYVDIGAHVKQGQLLAEIETPEVDQQLQQARADLGTSQANLHLAGITADRYQDLLKTNSVSQQETDNAVGALAADKATVAASQANVSRLEQLQSFEKIYAPFNGIITARKTDIGDLIDAGASGGSKTDLFDIAQADKLRVYANVPEAYSQAAKPGLTASLSLAEFPGRLFEGRLVRTAEAIDPGSRTLLVEIDVANPTGVLLTGSYAEVHLKLPGGASSYIVPVNALLFRKEGLRIAIVKDGKAALRPVTPGHDFGDQIEIVGGLQGDESIIVNPPDSIISGQPVRIAQSAAGDSL
ncbi:MAG TPA: efflux RND transporter periplasmic adaptor subunit [Candidatus Sulfotelmatobacter sp.]|jgi:RND family efflux transporter MFP subunit